MEQTTRPATRPEKMMDDCRMFRKLSEVISCAQPARPEPGVRAQ